MDNNGSKETAIPNWYDMFYIGWSKVDTRDSDVREQWKRTKCENERLFLILF